jgi:thiamine-monophosphate kinase
MDDDPPEGGRPSEFASIARWLRGAPAEGPSILRGPGGDVAWIQSTDALALSVDSMVEGVHFRRGWLTDAQVGRKAMAAALSDLAAAAAQPVGCLVALTLPEGTFEARGDRVMAGVREGSLRWCCPILGGDTTRGPFSISVTVIGAGSVFGRGGARPGDLLQLSGPVGHAAEAVAAFEAGDTPSPRALAAFVDPEPRLDLRDALSGASACIDVSDGLLADAAHLANASHVSLLVDPASVPGPTAHALHGGEDYELLATAPTVLPGFTVIGRVAEGEGMHGADGVPLPSRRGWDHGR